MNNKIIGILISMLFIGTIFFSTISGTKEEITTINSILDKWEYKSKLQLLDNDISIYNNPILSSNLSADLPIWQIDDYWVYNVNIIAKVSNFINGNFELSNLRFDVIEIQQDYYKLKYNGDINGEIIIAGLIEGNIKNTKIHGDVYIRKMDLAIEKSPNVVISGFIERDLVTNEFYLETSVQQNITPVVSPYDFPINLNETWNVPVISLWQHITANIDLLIPFEFDDQGPWYLHEHNFSCVEIDTIRLENGRYNDSYHVIDKDNDYEFWYSPTAKNIIKTHNENVLFYYNETIYWNLDDLYIELIDTNYMAPNNPPDKPVLSGTLNGKVRTSYQYDANTIDPEEDSLYYLFDWGDGTKSGWIGPYISGETATKYHSWIFKGSYSVKVKAKDQYGLESDWSDPLSVSMPKTKIYNPMTQLVFSIFERFPILEKILK